MQAMAFPRDQGSTYQVVAENENLIKDGERSGFTLIEVLIAMVILASVVGAGSALYHQYVSATLKSSRIILSCREIERLMPLIKEKIRDGLKSGEGLLPRMEARYIWQAEKNYEGRNIIIGGNEAGGAIQGNFILEMYNISINIEGKAGEKKRRVFRESYRELIWKKRGAK